MIGEVEIQLILHLICRAEIKDKENAKCGFTNLTPYHGLLLHLLTLVPRGLSLL